MAADLTFVAFRDDATVDEFNRRLERDYHVELLDALVGDPTRFGWFEFGPDYTYAAIDLLLDYWYRPKRVTRGRIAYTMVTLNLPDGEYRRQWRVGPGEGWGRIRYPWPGGRVNLGNRIARRQDVKRWLYAHKDWLLKAESW